MRSWPVCLLLALCSIPAHADDVAGDAKARAKVHLDAGTAYFNVQQYDKAAAEYQQAYLLDANPAYLYAIGQAQRLGGDCEKALLSYRAYLRTNPVDGSKAQKNIERCEQELKDRRPPEPGMTTLTPTASPPLVPPAPPRPVAEKRVAMVERPWTSDVIGHVLVGTGVLAAAAGTVLYLQGRSTIADHNTATTYDQFTRGDLDRAKTKQVVGVSLLAGGGALIVGGVVHYLVHGRPIPDEHGGVAVSLTPGGAALSFAGTF